MTSLSRVPTLDHLQALTTTAAYGSMGEAARRLGISQQAVSARVGAAEKVMGVAVFERSSTGVRPTGDGQLVLSWAQEVMQAAGALADGVVGVRSAQHRITVAASSTISEMLLPTWAVRLRSQHPDVALQVLPGNSQAAIAAVTQGRAQLGYVEGPSVPRTVRSHVVAHDELVVAVSPDHPWARRRNGISREELASTPLILREIGSGTRGHLDDVLTDHVAPVQTLDSNAAVRDTVRATGGATVLSVLAVAQDMDLGRLVRVPVVGLTMPRTLRAIWHPSQRPSGAVADLLRLSVPPAPPS
ncbi:hypothetical protein BKD30_03180 [Tersicoccus phoenicis]|uniref:HTH lysR-type domain-containing protein n=1 Tax=Tersicoccus phoenicis TaxID=554083 RepID=A0A1R1LJE9_9MICC|nr:LysR family transcriptional regulator [Tersicoccus phoenicis]OMH27661.1 hypothetical protein BKD30_03180 [Tersicoccus phoenicis]